MRLLIVASLALVSCATQAGGGGGGTDLPNAGAGPFRKLVRAEIGNFRSAPYVMDDGDRFARDASVVDRDGDPATLDVWGFFAANLAPDGGAVSKDDPPNAIIRLSALDGRSFDRSPITVLEPEMAWEGGAVGAPCVLMGEQVVLYFASAGGIGVAVGDGETFTQEATPVLGPGDGWEAGSTPGSPAVIRLPDGSYRMFYEVTLADGRARIGEARADDIDHWTRVGDGPALAPQEPGPDAVDDGGVGSPFAVLAHSEEGREILRLYYGAVDGQGRRAIGLAARYGFAAGAFERAPSPVFGNGESLGAREPAILPLAGTTLLFVTERAGLSTSKDYPAVAAGVAPATATLPPRNPK